MVVEGLRYVRGVVVSLDYMYGANALRKGSSGPQVQIENTVPKGFHSHRLLVAIDSIDWGWDWLTRYCRTRIA